MEDMHDTLTVDVFSSPKRLGRPSTGKAKSSAQRQAEYRRRKDISGEAGHANLNLWIDLRAKLALDRLAFRANTTPADMLAQLILAAQDDVLRGASEAEIDVLFNIRNT